MNDKEFINLVNKGIYHCNRGDVFQIVLSRKFFQKFKGDEFAAYRKLRSVNPSPYLFYFDFGDFKISHFEFLDFVSAITLSTLSNPFWTLQYSILVNDESLHLHL